MHVEFGVETNSIYFHHFNFWEKSKELNFHKIYQLVHVLDGMICLK